MDFMMPVLDGPGAAMALRQRGYTGVIIGVTGNALEDDRKRFIACGANAVVTKPLSPAALDSALAALGWTLPLHMGMTSRRQSTSSYSSASASGDTIGNCSQQLGHAGEI